MLQASTTPASINQQHWAGSPSWLSSTPAEAEGKHACRTLASTTPCAIATTQEQPPHQNTHALTRVLQAGITMPAKLQGGLVKVGDMMQHMIKVMQHD